MIARELPKEEWHRLAGTEAESLWPHLNPETARVLVVEDGGEIVATWTALRMVHMECLWVAPKYRGSFAVARRLFGGVREIAKSWGTTQILTGAMTDFVASLIGRLGGVRLPGEAFVLPVANFRGPKAVECKMEDVCQQH